MHHPSESWLDLMYLQAPRKSDLLFCIPIYSLVVAGMERTFIPLRQPTPFWMGLSPEEDRTRFFFH